MQEMHQDAGDAAAHPTLLTTKDVQGLIKVDKSTIYRMAEAGRLPAIKVGRQWRFPADRLYDWLDHPGAQLGPSATALGDLITSDSMQALTSLLGELLGVMVVVTDMAGRPLTDVGNPCGLFAAAHSHPGVLERCISGWRDMADDPDLEPQWKPTPLGFLCARTLVRVGAQLKGMVMVGGLAPEDWPPAPAEVERLAAGLEVPADLLSAHIGEVHRLNRDEQERLLRLLPRLGAFLSRLAADTESVTRAPSGPPYEPGRRSDQ
jgi:excisionase family DNA binding protein